MAPLNMLTPEHGDTPAHTAVHTCKSACSCVHTQLCIPTVTHKLPLLMQYPQRSTYPTHIYAQYTVMYTCIRSHVPVHVITCIQVHPAHLCMQVHTCSYFCAHTLVHTSTTSINTQSSADMIAHMPLHSCTHMHTCTSLLFTIAPSRSLSRLWEDLGGLEVLRVYSLAVSQYRGHHCLGTARGPLRAQKGKGMQPDSLSKTACQAPHCPGQESPSRPGAACVVEILAPGALPRRGCSLVF